MANTIKIKLVRSLIGTSETQKKTVQALGLKKIGSVVERPDTPATRGAVRKVAHLVSVTEA